MTHAHILTIKRPHEALGLPIPIGRKISALGKGTWLLFLGCLSVFCVGVYVYQISLAAPKGYEMRKLERQREALLEHVSALETKVAQLQSMNAIQERVKGMGYVPVQQMEYLDVSGPTYALVK